MVCDGAAALPALPGCQIVPSTGFVDGPAKTRNRGLAVARGDFIVFLDADDYLLPRGLENLLRQYRKGIAGYVYGDAYTIEPSEHAQSYAGHSDVTILRPAGEQEPLVFWRRSAPDYSQKDLQSYNIHVVTALVPRYAAIDCGGFDETVDAWEDWTFWIRMAQRGQCGLRIPVPIFVYRVYEGDRMRRFYNGDRSHMQTIWDKYRDESGVIPMANCCGGDPSLSKIAGDAIAGMTDPQGLAVGRGLVRVRYLGDERGSVPYEITRGRIIRLGNNASNRFADVTADEYGWLQSHGVAIEVVPPLDDPIAPPKPLRPILTDDDVAVSVLRP
jgi:glycosyltransferase involved in cell wall biosynthesis